MLVSKIDVCPPQAKKIWKFWSKIVKFAHFGVSESGVRTAFQVLAKLVLTPGPEQVLACVQHLAHLSVSIPVPTPFKRWNRTPDYQNRRSACRLVCLVDAAGSFSAAPWPHAVALGASESW